MPAQYHKSIGSGKRECVSNGRSSGFVRFVVSDRQGQPFEVDPAALAKCPLLSDDSSEYNQLKQFVANELGASVDAGKVPQHIAYMRDHNLVGYCDVSEKGHLKWFPNGLLIQKLLSDYAGELARNWGAFEMRNPLLIRGDNNEVGELMGEFHERDYKVDGGRGIGYLRYASDPMAFPFMQKVQFSRKQSPLKVYEEAVCFRNEQQGEVSGLRRVRNFIMTDMHAACISEDQAWKEFGTLCNMFADLMNHIIAHGRWVLGWEGTVQFYEEHRRKLLDIGKNLGVPAFFKLMPEMNHYFAMKNEFQAITADGANIQVSTVQWDVKDGERFQIGYVDDAGKKHPCPVILHASSFGSIERTLCAILENIAIEAGEGRVPMFPLWLAPVQVRFIPVSQVHLPFVMDYCEQLNQAGIRSDVDDRNATVGKRIRDAAKAWIPYVAVMGDRERDAAVIPVRVRENGTVEEMLMDELIRQIQQESKGMPGRPLPLQRLVSKRPLFLG